MADVTQEVTQEVTQATLEAMPALTPVLTAELGSRLEHDMWVSVAIHGGYLYATHSFTPRNAPNSPDGLGDLVVLDLATLAEVRRMRVNAQPRRVAVNRLTGRVYVLGRADAPGPVTLSLVMIDPGATAPLGEVTLLAGVVDVAVNPATGRVYLADARTRSLRVFDPDGNETANIPVGEQQPVAVAVDETRDRVYIALAAPTENRLVVVDGAAGAVVSSILLDTTNVVPQDVAVDETRDEVYVACQGNIGSTVPSVFAVSPATGAVRRLERLPTAGRTVDVDPAVGQVYAGGDGRLNALDAASGTLREQVSFEGVPGRIAVDRATGLVYVGERWTGRVVAYRSAVQRPAPPPTLTLSSNAGRMNLFRQAADGTLETAAYSEATDWEPFVSLGGQVFPLGTRFASLSPEGGRWWLFGVDAAGVLWGTSGAARAAGAWQPIGSGFVPGAEIAWAAPFSGEVFLFAVDAAGAVRSFIWDDAGPRGNEGVHDGLTFAPGASITAVSRQPGHWDLFVLHPDGRVYTQWWSTDEDSFSAWGALEGASFQQGTRISSLGRRTDQLDLFAVDPAGRVVSIFWNNEQEWASWGPVAGGGSFPPGAPVAVTNHDPDNITLFAVGTDAQIWSTFWDTEDGWDDWGLLGALAGAPGAAVTAGRRGPGELDVCWLAPNGEVGHAWWNRVQDDAWSLERGVNRMVGTPSAFFPEAIRTPFPVDGDIRITIWEDGSYLVRGHMHGSGFDDYDFIVQAAVPVVLDRGTGAFVAALETYRAGHVDGWQPFGGEERSYDWAELGVDPRVRSFFPLLGPERNLIVSHAVKNDGFGAALDSLVNDVILGYLVPDVLEAVGGTVVMAAALGRGLEDLIGVDLDGAPGLLGLGIITIGTGGTYWLAVPAAAVLIPMLLPGFPIIGVNTRNMRAEEWAWAARVFGNNASGENTLPHYDNIFITNLRNPRGGAFTSVNNGRYLVHMGEQAFLEPTLDIETTDDGPTVPGQIFIHELTHVWDAYHSGLDWEGRALVAQLNPPDDLPDATRSWTDLGGGLFGLFSGIEYKAIAIAEWYRRYSQHPQGLDGTAARDDEYFRYVRDHIRVPSN